MHKICLVTTKELFFVLSSPNLSHVRDDNLIILHFVVMKLQKKGGLPDIPLINRPSSAYLSYFEPNSTSFSPIRLMKALTIPWGAGASCSTGPLFSGAGT